LRLQKCTTTLAFVLLLLPACRDWWDELRPPSRRPERAQQAKPPAKLVEEPPTPKPRPAPSPDVVKAIRDLALAMKKALDECGDSLNALSAKEQLGADLNEPPPPPEPTTEAKVDGDKDGAKTPEPKRVPELQQACNLLAKVPARSLRHAVALAGELDRALVAFAGLHPDLLQLAKRAPRRATDEDHLPGEWAEEVAEVSLRLEELKRQLKELAEEADTLHTSAADLHVLSVDAPSFVDTAAALVRSEVVDPVWRGIMDDVRRRVIKGRSPALERGELCFSAARAALARVASAVEKEGKERPQLKTGFAPYRVSVEAFVDRMDDLRQTLQKLRTRAQRLQILNELRYIATRYRSAIDEDHRLWHEAAVAADRRLRKAQERRQQILRKVEGNEQGGENAPAGRSPQTPRREQ
jgi:hypothetical protein